MMYRQTNGLEAVSMRRGISTRPLHGAAGNCATAVLMAIWLEQIRGRSELAAPPKHSFQQRRAKANTSVKDPDQDCVRRPAT
jgi:hypothetical protein